MVRKEMSFYEFKNYCHGTYLRYWNETISEILNLYIALILPIIFIHFDILVWFMRCRLKNFKMDFRTCMLFCAVLVLSTKFREDMSLQALQDSCNCYPLGFWKQTILKMLNLNVSY